MSNNVKVLNQVLKSHIDNDLTLFPISFVIVPYDISGYLSISNKGFVLENTSVYDHETYKRVWSGNDACILTWKGSLILEQDQETKEMKRTYKLGEVFLGSLLNNDGENRISEDSSFRNYKSQDVQNILRFRVNSTYFQLNDDYLFKFYKVPELSQSQLYRIVSLDKEFIGRTLIGYIIQLQTINQELSTTGRAKQQSIMPNSPGQAWLECVVLEEKNFDTEGLVEGKDYYKLYDRVITADYTKAKSFRPVKKVSVKAHGTCIFSNISFVGREVRVGAPIEEYGEMGLVFPINLNNTDTPTLYNSQAKETNFYYGEFTPTLKFWQDLMDNIKGAITPVNQWQYQGFLEYNAAKVKATNKIIAETKTFKNELFGYKVSTGGNNWEIKPWEIELEKDYNTAGNYGCDTAYNLKGSHIIHDLMFHSYWIQKKAVTLPMNSENTIGLGSLIGFTAGALITGKTYAAAALFGIGTLLLVAGKLLNPKLESFMGFVPTALIDLNENQFKKEGEVADKIPLNTFESNNENTPNEVYFSGKTMTTAFQANLTNRMIDTELTKYTYLKTENIGQTKFRDGTFIKEDKSPYLLSGKNKLLEIPDSENIGFIIDSFNIQAIFSGDYTIEFLDDLGNIIWTGIYQSEGKWTESLREINTWKNTSIFNRENLFIGEPAPYPGPLPPPQSETGFLQDINLSVNIFYNQGFYQEPYIQPPPDDPTRPPVEARDWNWAAKDCNYVLKESGFSLPGEVNIEATFRDLNTKTYTIPLFDYVTGINTYALFKSKYTYIIFKGGVYYSINNNNKADNFIFHYGSFNLPKTMGEFVNLEYKDANYDKYKYTDYFGWFNEFNISYHEFVRGILFGIKNPAVTQGSIRYAIKERTGTDIIPGLDLVILVDISKGGEYPFRPFKSAISPSKISDAKKRIATSRAIESLIVKFEALKDPNA